MTLVNHLEKEILTRKELVFLIPAYNESNTILSVVNSALKYGDVMVVNDCSNDETANIVSKTDALLINNEVNLGYEKSLVVGIRKGIELGYKYLITLDGDGQLNPHKTFEILNLLKTNAIVVGNRNSKARISEIIAGHISRILFGFQDPFCGLKGYSLKYLSDTTNLYSQESIGTELLIRMAKGQRPISELNIEVIDRQGTQSTFGTNSIKLNIKFLYYFIRIIVKGEKI